MPGSLFSRGRLCCEPERARDDRRINRFAHRCSDCRYREPMGRSVPAIRGDTAGVHTRPASRLMDRAARPHHYCRHTRIPARAGSIRRIGRGTGRSTRRRQCSLRRGSKPANASKRALRLAICEGTRASRPDGRRRLAIDRPGSGCSQNPGSFALGRRFREPRCGQPAVREGYRRRVGRTPRIADERGRCHGAKCGSYESTRRLCSTSVASPDHRRSHRSPAASLRASSPPSAVREDIRKKKCAARCENRSPHRHTDFLGCLSRAS